MKMCQPYDNSFNNQVVSNTPSVEKLDLRNYSEGFQQDDNWFRVCSFGRNSDDTLCVTEAFQSLMETLEKSNASLKQVLKIMMYVDSMESYAVMNKKYCSYFGLNPPVRVCVGVSRDMFPDNCRLVLCGIGSRANSGHSGHLHRV